MVFKYSEFKKLFENKINDVIDYDLDEVSIDGEFYHGTSIESVDDLFTSLETGHSDYDAIWVTDDEYIAKEFSEYKFYDGDIKIIYKLNIQLDNIVRLTIGDLDIFREFYDITDLRDMIPYLEKEYNGWLTNGSIGSRIYDDYAIFDADSIEIVEAMYSLDGGDNWSEYMSLEELEKEISK